MPSSALGEARGFSHLGNSSGCLTNKKKILRVQPYCALGTEEKRDSQKISEVGANHFLPQLL